MKCAMLVALVAIAGLSGCESTKWQYKKSPDHDVERMNIYGAGGWELVGTDPADGDKLIYKRKVDSGSALP